MRFTCSVFILLAVRLYADSTVDEHVLIVAEPPDRLERVVINTQRDSSHLPANDGADFLKQVPGFTVSRKGGSGGDIHFRGQSGSRIGIVVDGQQLSGTCGGRMDPPTSYIQPSAFDDVSVIKGPQSVKYGPVGSAGTVIYETKHHHIKHPQAAGHIQSSAASYERVDTHLSTHFGNETIQLKTQGAMSRSGNYRDGAGEMFESAYENAQASAFLGFFPSNTQQITVDVNHSTGHANFSDRKTKARKIAHDGLSLRYVYTPSESVFDAFDMQIYDNASFHIMDTFDLAAIQPQVVGMAPERHFRGGHVWLDMGNDNAWSMIVGVDGFSTRQKTRSANSLGALLAKVPKPVYEMTNIGAFLESETRLKRHNLVAGLRLDHHQTELLGSWKSADKETTHQDTGYSGFIRWETSGWLADTFIGIGLATRFPDYWEVMKHQKSLGLAPEKTTQMDLGFNLHTAIAINANLFYGQTVDFILIDTLSRPIARNIDATLWGGELGVQAEVASAFQFIGSLAYTRGENTTDKQPLPQIAPLESRIGLDYQHKDLKIGCQCRCVAAQKRIAKGQGSITGIDLGQSSAFTTVAVNLAYQLPYGFMFSGGVDNLFNTVYSEHVSRSGAGNLLVPPDERTLQVNEPGRTIWATLVLAF
ncbi:MAG: TonB-dependent copper receptor [Cellvibrionales bacterium]|nr:TonB-dependent copper receptor [Cellvibrionales bacterium]